MDNSVSTPKPGLQYGLDTSSVVITNNGRSSKLVNVKKQDTNNKSQCTMAVDIDYNPTTFTSSDEILLRVACYHESLSGNKNYSVYKNDKKPGRHIIMCYLQYQEKKSVAAWNKVNKMNHGFVERKERILCEAILKCSKNNIIV